MHLWYHLYFGKDQCAAGFPQVKLFNSVESWEEDNLVVQTLVLQSVDQLNLSSPPPQSSDFQPQNPAISQSSHSFLRKCDRRQEELFLSVYWLNVSF